MDTIILLEAILEAHPVNRARALLESLERVRDHLANQERVHLHPEDGVLQAAAAANLERARLASLERARLVNLARVLLAAALPVAALPAITDMAMAKTPATVTRIMHSPLLTTQL